MSNLNEKVVIITGSASGLGKGMAEKFAQNGYKVVIADLKKEAAQSVADELKNNFKIETLAIEMDVTNENQVNSGIDYVVEKFGKIDVLISNAGIQTISPIVDFETAAWKRLIDIHLNGTFFITRACMRKMIELKTGGRIIVTGSVHSVEASKNKAAYVSAKHAQLGFVRAVAKEGAEHGISSNLICPGFVKTPLVEKQIPEQAKTLGISEKDVVKKIMLGDTVDGEFTTVDDVAEVALFLANFKTAALTGQHLIVSHGWAM